MNEKKAAFHNLGCKVNAYETEAMQQLLEQEGYQIVPFEEAADVYIINTCTVTNIADRKSRQMLHKAKRRNPEAVVVAVGCYVQAAKAELEADPAIDIVIGNNKKKDLVQILAEYQHEQYDEHVIEMDHIREYENLSIHQTAEHTRAYIKVQDGCNQFCSYCIIPYTRGRVRSRSLTEIVSEVATLAANGYQEVVLTGIHLSSYGCDIDSDLLRLIQAVHQVDGIKRIRLGSLEPRVITEEFAAALVQLPKVCRHFHLSLQSGCDDTLKRMNRRYSTAEFRDKCRLLRQTFANPAITTDIIVGFPGETEEEFALTRKFLEEIAFAETHIFKYSKRQGTKAAVMENQVADQIKARRSQILLELNSRNKRRYEDSWSSKTVTMLPEEQVSLAGADYLTGHTGEYLKLALPAGEAQVNQIVNVTVGKERKNKILLCSTDNNTKN